MTYSVKEVFYTIQGEGAQAGRAAVFCRFSGCNLWTGLEKHRAEAICQFCDTDFVGTDGPGGGKFATSEQLAAHVAQTWSGEPGSGKKLVVCTGGEPALQLDEPLIKAFHGQGFEVAIETNGTIRLPAGIDWVCVSPKAGSDLVVKQGDELKLVFPQQALDPENLQRLEFKQFFLQPMDGSEVGNNTKLVVDYCRKHPRWRVSLQTHKILGIP